MNKIKSYFQFSREHRSGIFLLLGLILLAQIAYFLFADKIVAVKSPKEDAAWLAMQNEIDSLKQIVALKKDTIYPFNPNFLTDYKGYKLGLSVAEIDRLHAFRSQNNYVNSAKHFQLVTKVSDELLNKLAPYFKFPDWVTHKKDSYEAGYTKFPTKEKAAIIQKDINTASREDLIAAYGIGEKLADKILLEKDKFGEFASMEQLEFIWGISPEAIADLQKRFFVKNPSALKKIAINELSIKELATFPYFNYALAKEIVIYRTMNNGIKDIDDLTKIKGMPNEKLKIIALYLEF